MLRKTNIIIIFFLFLLISCGSSQQETITGHCHLGLASLFKNEGNINLAQQDFNEYFNETPVIDSFVNSLSIMRLEKYIDYDINVIESIYDVDLYFDDGWCLGIHLKNKYGHFLYVDNIYPINDNQWSVSIIETTGGFELKQFKINNELLILDGQYKDIVIDHIYAYKNIE